MAGHACVSAGPYVLAVFFLVLERNLGGQRGSKTS